MKKIAVALLAGMMVSTSFAQNEGQAPLDKQFVIYKWYVGKVANYGKAPPRGVTNYTMLNQYGMVISKDRPYENGTSSNVIRAIRPEDAEKAGNVSHQATPDKPTTAESNEAPEGSISRAALCDQQRQNLETLKNKKTVYEDNGGDNLVPLTDQQKADRIKNIQDMLDSTCAPKDSK